MQKKSKNKNVVTIYSKRIKLVSGGYSKSPALKIAGRHLTEVGISEGDQYKVVLERDRIVLTKINISFEVAKVKLEEMLQIVTKKGGFDFLTKDETVLLKRYTDTVKMYEDKIKM